MDENLFNNLVDLIHEYKNVRSKLEALIVWIINQSAIPVIGSALYGGEITTVLPFRVLEFNKLNRSISVQGNGALKLHLFTRSNYG